MKQALAAALEAKGYETLTAVQEAVTAPETLGRDMLVSAQTGSGKTLGFGLAIAPTLLGEAEQFGHADAPLALVIAPTRELAMQVKRELSWLFAQAGATLASTVGGMDMRDERRALARGAHVVVATPGRLRDHVMRGSIDLSALRAVVLDEADEMLDLGFREDLEFILDACPADRQTLLFSATVPAAIARLAENYQTDALRIATTSGTSQHADIEYRALNVSARDTENAIINVLRFYEAPNAIIFCNTRAMVGRLTTRLSNRGFSVVALSGELSQAERTHALQAMRDGRARVCVATDVAARGIDLPNLELVIHAELPSNQDTLLHRSGRTGRAGRKGISALIVPPAARKKAHRLLGWAKLKAEWANAPSASAVRAKDDTRMLESLEEDSAVENTPEPFLDTLTQRFTAQELAAAYVQLYRARHSPPEELSDPEAPAKPRSAFGPSVWFSVAGGHAVGAEPRRILPMICKAGDLSRDDIGAIRVQKDTTLVEIRQSAVAGFLAAVGPEMTLEAGATLEQLKTAPSFESRPRKQTGGPGKGKPTKDRQPERDRAKSPAPKEKRKPRDPEVHAARKPRVSKDPAKPETKPRKPRGPKPPPGKPSSKKNRARKLAKEQAAGAAARKSGTAKPKRPHRKG